MQPTTRISKIMFQVKKSSTRSGYIELLSIKSMQSTHDLPISKKWSNVYWLLMKVMRLFHGRKTVLTRRCERCLLLKHEREKECGAVSPASRGFDMPLSSDLSPTTISSPAGWLDEKEEDDDVNENTTEDKETMICEVCRSMWWNADGKWFKYYESDIGKPVQSFVSDIVKKTVTSTAIPMQIFTIELLHLLRYWLQVT